MNLNNFAVSPIQMHSHPRNSRDWCVNTQSVVVVISLNEWIQSEGQMDDEHC